MRYPNKRHTQQKDKLMKLQRVRLPCIRIHKQTSTNLSCFDRQFFLNITSSLAYPDKELESKIKIKHSHLKIKKQTKKPTRLNRV